MIFSDWTASSSGRTSKFVANSPGPRSNELLLDQKSHTLPIALASGDVGYFLQQEQPVSCHCEPSPFFSLEHQVV